MFREITRKKQKLTFLSLDMDFTSFIEKRKLNQKVWLTLFILYLEWAKIILLLPTIYRVDYLKYRILRVA